MRGFARPSRPRITRTTRPRAALLTAPIVRSLAPERPARTTLVDVVWTCTIIVALIGGHLLDLRHERWLRTLEARPVPAAPALVPMDDALEHIASARGGK